MRRVRVGIVGAGPLTEWAILPALSGPDAMAPPDSGAWWIRRPTAHSDINYQPAARPEVVALADSDQERAERVAGAARVRAVYSDWRLMLREVQLDALICAAPPQMAAEVVMAVDTAVSRLWLEGPPAASAAATLRLMQRLDGKNLRLWCARPLRRAAAHRAAERLIERHEIGAVSALLLRWGAPFYVPSDGATGQGGVGPGGSAARDEAAHLASCYAALDLLLAFASSSEAAAIPNRVLAGANNGATTLWLRFASGVTASALFAGAENWSATLPRLEICGAEGRTLICEAGRRLWQHQPREAARLLEPPGLAAHISSANLVGVAEDLKAFMNVCAESDTASRFNPDCALNSDALKIRREPGLPAAESPTNSLLEAARVLQLMEAVAESLKKDRVVEIEPLRDAKSKTVLQDEMPCDARRVEPEPATLTLQL